MLDSPRKVKSAKAKREKIKLWPLKLKSEPEFCDKQIIVFNNVICDVLS